jgi:hypothetical protein
MQKTIFLSNNTKSLTYQFEPIFRLFFFKKKGSKQKVYWELLHQHCV